MGQPCGFAKCVLVQHRLHLVLSARAALTAGLACKAPSTETEAIVARAISGVTSWAMVTRPSTLMCKHLARALRRFEILAGVIPEPEVQTLSCCRLLDPSCTMRST